MNAILACASILGGGGYKNCFIISLSDNPSWIEIFSNLMSIRPGNSLDMFEYGIATL